MQTQVETPQSRCKFALVHTDITPPPNIYHRMWGAAKQDRATGIHRPLRATVLLLSPNKGFERLFIIALDHCFMWKLEMDNLIDAVIDETGLLKEEFIVCFSHTHAAGLMGLERVSMPGGELIPPYLEYLADCVVKLINEVQEKHQPTTILYGQGVCNLASDRDFWDKDNKIWACGYNPVKKADNTVIVARAIAENGKLVGTIVNYACHPTTLAWENTLISPDYPGAMRETIEDVTGAPCLFLQGASGDLGPVEGYVGDPSIADRNGRQLAYAALSALESIPAPGSRFEYLGPKISSATLGEWKHKDLPGDAIEANSSWNFKRLKIPLPIRPGTPSIEQIEFELKQWEKKNTLEARAITERKRRLIHKLKQLPEGNELNVEAILLNLGRAVWVILQGEYYSILQLNLRKRFPKNHLIITTIASHWGLSYLVPSELYGKGIYQESIAITAPGSLEKVIDTLGDKIETFLGSN